MVKKTLKYVYITNHSKPKHEMNKLPNSESYVATGRRLTDLTGIVFDVPPFMVLHCSVKNNDLTKYLYVVLLSLISNGYKLDFFILSCEIKLKDHDFFQLCSVNST